MPDRKQRPQPAFGDDYADRRDPEQLSEDRARARRQVANVTQRGDNRAFQRELLESLRRRRAGRNNLVQFEVVYGPDEDPILVVSGELLIRAQNLEEPGVREFLASYELQPQPVDCLDGRVLRLVNRGLDAQRLADVAGLLRAQGFATSLDHVTPLAPVAKGLGGPEPAGAVAASGPFPAGAAEPVVVAVIDTGVVGELRGDGWLGAVVRTADNVDLLDDIPAPNGFLDFGAGHGTFAAGIVARVAPDAEIRVYKALDSDGIGSEVDVACAIVRAVREGAQVVNLSLGSMTLDDQPSVAVDVALEIVSELEQETKRDVVVVAAAGNSASRRPTFPAAARRVVSVAALTPHLAPARWSNHGFWVTCSAVGEGLVSTYVAGQESTEVDPDPDHFDPDAWALWTGTSFAAPQVAGAVARLVRERGGSARAALLDLLSRGAPVPDYGVALDILPGS